MPKPAAHWLHFDFAYAGRGTAIATAAGKRGARVRCGSVATSLPMAMRPATSYVQTANERIRSRYTDFPHTVPLRKPKAKPRVKIKNKIGTST